MTSQLPTPYVGVRVLVPPLAAQAALDTYRGKSTKAFVGGVCWAVTCGPVTLALEGSGVIRRYRASDALRRWVGRIRSERWWISIPVELELSPWSSRCCEIGIRPRSSRFRSLYGASRRHYLELANRLAEHLGAELDRLAFEAVSLAVEATDHPAIEWLSEDRPAV